MEVLTVIIIMGLLISALAAIYQSNIKTWQATERQAEIHQNLRIALDIVTKDIRQTPENLVTIINNGSYQEIVLRDAHSLLEKRRFAVINNQLNRLDISPPGVGIYVYNPVTTEDLDIVAFQVYKKTIGLRSIFDIYIKGKMTGSGGNVLEMELRTQVVPRIN